MTKGKELDDPTEVLYRQVHPNFVHEGKLTSLAFRPNSGDSGKMSCDRSSLVTAKASFDHYVYVKKRKSEGVWGVSVQECADQKLTCYPDPVEENDAHSTIDFNGVEEKNWERVSKKLKSFAIGRKRFYPEEGDGSV